MPIIPPQHMPVPSHSICLCHLNHCFLQSQHLHQVLCPLFLHQFCTTRCSLSPSQNCYLIFPQTPRLTPIIITSPLLHNSDKPFLSPSARTSLSSATFPELHPANSCSCCHSCLAATTCIYPIPQITETSHRFHLFTHFLHRFH